MKALCSHIYQRLGYFAPIKVIYLNIHHIHRLNQEVLHRHFRRSLPGIEAAVAALGERLAGGPPVAAGGGAARPALQNLALLPLDGGLLRPRRGLAASVSDTVALYLEIFRLPKFFDHNTFQLCISYNKFTKNLQKVV